MAKQIMEKHLIFLNFDKNEFRFYNIKVLSVGYNKMQVITSYGNLGTKGKEHITKVEGSDDTFNQALKLAYNKIYEKKNEQYVSLNRVKEAFATSSFYPADKKKKKTEPTQLVLLNFDKHEFRFYNVEVLSVGYNKLHVISSHGRLGTKGREQLSRFEQDTNVFKEALSFSQHKVYEKKRDGYITKEHAIHVYDTLVNELFKKTKSKKGKKPETVSNKKRVEFGYHCDKCSKIVKPAMFDKINEWARGEGNWDSIPQHKNKIYCLDCQFDLDIFKKKLSSRSSS